MPPIVGDGCKVLRDLNSTSHEVLWALGYCFANSFDTDSKSLLTQNPVLLVETVIYGSFGRTTLTLTMS